ncbi:MAG: cobalt ECF transporter T component CbiQ [Methanobrevibacter sp.]|nr:cobalt ECF transporter T component CbiQ [Methanobrevibacter sp.]
MGLEIDYIAHENNLKDINPNVKIIISFFLMILAILINLPIVSILITVAIAIILLTVAKVPLRFYLKFISIPFGFSLITCIFLVFFFGTGPVIFDTGFFNIVVRSDALELGITTFFRTLACFSSLGFLSSTTPIAEIVHSLSIIKIPQICIEIALLMYNSVFIFLDQIEVMTNAQKTRLGYYGFNNSYRSFGLLISNLFFKSLEKGEQLQQALDSRGYTGSIPKYSA